MVFPGIWKRKTEQPSTNSRKLRIGRLAPVVLHRSISLGVALEWISRPHFFGHEGRSTVDERSMRRRTSRVARRTSRVADSRYNHRLQPRPQTAGGRSISLGMARRAPLYHYLILWNVPVALAFTALLPRRLSSLELRKTSIAGRATPRDATLLSEGDDTSLLLVKIDQFIDAVSTQHVVDTSLIRQRAELDHEKDLSAALSTGIPFEHKDGKPSNSSSCGVPEYEFVKSNGRNLVSRTSASSPILSREEVVQLRSAVEAYWSNQTVDQSRFR